MNKLIAAALLTIAMTGTAFASSCPMHVKAIDAALAANPALTAEQLAEAKALRDEGEKLHADGKHAESMETLAKAEKILGISQ